MCTYGCVFFDSSTFIVVFVMFRDLLKPYVPMRFLDDESYRDRHLRVINALLGREVLGVHTPDVKRIAKELSANAKHWLDCLEAGDSEVLSYEEILLWGFLINFEKCSLECRLWRLSRYVPVLDNWAVCDAFCAHAKWVKCDDRVRVWEFVSRYFLSKREFEVRFAVVFSMSYFLDEEYLSLVFQCVDGLCFDEIESEYICGVPKSSGGQVGVVSGVSPYYVRMGVAWLLATSLSKFPDETRAFVRRSHLPDDVVRLYVRKARESFRTRKMSAM